MVGPGYFGHSDDVGKGEGFGKLVLEDSAAGGVGARFEECDEAAARIFAAECGDGFPESRGVMPKVIDEREASHFGMKFETTFDPFKFLKGFGDLGQRNLVKVGGGHGHGSVLGVVSSEDGYGERMIQHAEGDAVRRSLEIGDANPGVFIEADLDQLTLSVPGDFDRVGVIGVDDEHAIAWDDVD